MDHVMLCVYKYNFHFHCVTNSICYLNLNNDSYKKNKETMLSTLGSNTCDTIVTCKPIVLYAHNKHMHLQQLSIITIGAHACFSRHAVRIVVILCSFEEQTSCINTTSSCSRRITIIREPSTPQNDEGGDNKKKKQN